MDRGKPSGGLEVRRLRQELRIRPQVCCAPHQRTWQTQSHNGPPPPDVVGAQAARPHAALGIEEGLEGQNQGLATRRVPPLVLSLAKPLNLAPPTAVVNQSPLLSLRLGYRKGN